MKVRIDPPMASKNDCERKNNKRGWQPIATCKAAMFGFSLYKITAAIRVVTPFTASHVALLLSPCRAAAAAAVALIKLIAAITAQKNNAGVYTRLCVGLFYLAPLGVGKKCTRQQRCQQWELAYHVTGVLADLILDSKFVGIYEPMFGKSSYKRLIGCRLCVLNFFHFLVVLSVAAVL
jgi:hypothetical protein